MSNDASLFESSAIQPLPQLWRGLPKNLEAIDTQSDSLIIGAPLSGKTTTLRNLQLALIESGLQPDEILTLTPTRQTAAALRDQIALDTQLPSSTHRAQSISSFAFSILDAVALTSGAPRPRLLSGAQQQGLIAQLVQELAQSFEPVALGIPASTLALPGLHAELRDLIAVCQEHNLTAAALAQLSVSFAMPRLALATAVLPKYQARLAELGLQDPSTLIAVCSGLIAETPALVAGIRAVLVDDAQEFTPSGFALLAQLGKLAPIHAFADPDATVMGFRSAGSAELVGSLSQIAANRRGLQRFVLDPQFKVRPAEVSALLSLLAARLAPNQAGAQRRILASNAASPAESAECIEQRVFLTQSAEADWLATRLREQHLAGTPWSQMAVVARTRNQLEQLQAALLFRGVPVRIEGSQLALRDQFAARGLLELAKAICDPEAISAELAENLVQSVFCGLDSIGLRRLSRQLRHAEDTSEGSRSWHQLLVEAVSIPAVGLELESKEGRQVSRLATLIQKFGSQQITSSHMLVSQIWAASKLQEPWLERAAGSSEIAAATNRDLDSLLELFASSERFDQRNPDSKPIEFINRQLELALPEDSLAPVGLKPAVTLATPAGLLGRNFAIIAMPRLQDGIWPNLRPRNSLLGATSLDSYLRGRQADPSKPAKSELAEELRLFYRALGSATSRVLLSAMQSPEEQPSQLFSILFGAAPEPEHYERSFDLRHKVAELRRGLLQGRLENAPQLALLALQGVAGADPSGWLGMLGPSTQQPLAAEGQNILLRPSQLEKFEACPLHWFIQSHGGDGSGFEASLGTLLHEALELAGQDEASMWQFVESKWHTLEFEANWVESGQKRRAQRMVLALSQYLLDGNSAELVTAEATFNFILGRLEISGKLDRLERAPDGSMIVADLKTGRQPSAEEVLKNRQLELYQLAVQQQLAPGKKLAGARIISVGSGKLKVLTQPALEGESLQSLTELLNRAETEMGAGQFTAAVSEHCLADGNDCHILLAPAVTNA